MIRSAVLGSALLAIACSQGPRPRDTVARNTGGDAGPPSEVAVAAPPAPAPLVPPPASAKLRLLVRASCRALALDETRVFFGNNDDDALLSVKKEGGEPVRLARRAPVAGALALAADGSQITWIATPGDVVLRTAAGGGTPATLRDKGIFADVATQGGDVFVAEVVPGGGALTRISGGATTRIATFDGGPRALAVDATNVFVATAQKLLRAAHDKGDVSVLATGGGFDSPVVDDDAVIVATVAGTSRRLVRIPKKGGEPKTLAEGLRAAPIAIEGGEVFYFDGVRPALLSVPAVGGEPRVIATDDALARPSALAADKSALYVATGEREDGAIWVIERAKR